MNRFDLAYIEYDDFISILKDNKSLPGWKFYLLEDVEKITVHVEIYALTLQEAFLKMFYKMPAKNFIFSGIKHTIHDNFSKLTNAICKEGEILENDKEIILHNKLIPIPIYFSTVSAHKDFMKNQLNGKV